MWSINVNLRLIKVVDFVVDVDVVDIVVVANVVVVTLLVVTGHITFSCGVFLWWVGGWDG